MSAGPSKLGPYNGRGRKALGSEEKPQGEQKALDLRYRCRFARRDSAAARVSSFLQKVKRTWEAPSWALL